jgi:hypothetical protein
MEIVREDISVVPDAGGREVVIVLGGYRISLDEEEARLLSTGIAGALAALPRAGAGAVAAPPGASPRGKTVAEGDAVLDGLRQLVEARRDRRAS